ncbi:MAG TPA: hypothetical protein VFJ85_04755 [Acidimicrobiales bacterium]|nr:hypothetical protein [Acidimicrobiales bacterium]
MTSGHGPGDWPVLDVGGEVGALVVHLAAVPAGGELEAQPAGRPGRRFHTGVHLRPVAGHLGPVALFPEVVEGAYQVLGEDHLPLAVVDVAGGRVTTLDLRGGRHTGAGWR